MLTAQTLLFLWQAATLAVTMSLLALTATLLRRIAMR